METQFYKDLNAAKAAEKIVRDYLLSLGCYQIEDISENPDFYNIGDIKLTKSMGQVRYIEVKDDSRIHETKNVLCEEWVE